MNVLVLTHTGINNGPVVKALLEGKGHEVKSAAVRDKNPERVTTRKFIKAAKEVLDLELPKIQGTPVEASDIADADVVILENKNNLNLVKRRLGKEALEGKTVHILEVPSGFRCHVGDECNAQVTKLKELVDGLTLQ